MRALTLNEHPDCTAVLQAEPGMGAAACAAWARAQLEQPRYNSAVLFLPRQSVTHDFSAAVEATRLSGENIRGVYDLADPGDFSDPQKVREILLRRERAGGDGAARIGELFGSDFSLLRDSCLALGPTSLDIRSYDRGNNKPHVDRGKKLFEGDVLGIPKAFYDPKVKEKQIPGGITATLADHGGGTWIIDVPTKQFDFDPKTLLWEWTRKDFNNDDIWAVPDRAVTFMRAQSWDKDHQPCPHRSPDRKDDSSWRERIVGVGFVCRFT